MNTGPGHSAHGPSSLPNWWPADPRHTSTSTSDVMSQLCRVCGEPAAGFHFGAFTCEGCKSFFGRTYNNLGSISECKNNGECVINKKNRTSCKACRLRKCLVVGMSKSGSRYGRRSNWFKIHCLLQEQQQQQQQHHHQQHHPLQNPLPNALQNPLQNPQFQSAGLAAGLQHFQHHLHQRSLHAAGRPSARDAAGPTPPPPWADVKHHLRLDADNNNSVAGDLNDKPDAPGGRLSAAAAVVQAVRPELLRWPSPFFPAFPFPPPAPFFLALQPPPQPQPPPPPQQVARSSGSPASRSSSRSAVEEEDDDDGGGGGGGGGEDDGQPAPKRAAVGRELPPVQDSPMDLSVSAAVPPPPSSSPRPSPSSPSSSSSPSSPSSSRSSSRSASPSDGGGADDHRPSAAADHHRHHRRHHQRRRRRRWRRAEDAADGRTGGGGSESDGDGSGPRRRGDGRPAKNVPLDLTCDRS